LHFEAKSLLLKEWLEGEESFLFFNFACIEVNLELARTLLAWNVHNQFIL
jgi:hypothetical protein